MIPVSNRLLVPPTVYLDLVENANLIAVKLEFDLNWCEI